MCVQRSDLGEEGASDELLVLQEGDSLCAAQLFGQIRHISLQLRKPWHTQTHTADQINNINANTKTCSSVYACDIQTCFIWIRIRAFSHCLWVSAQTLIRCDNITVYNVNMKQLGFKWLWTHTHTHTLMHTRMHTHTHASTHTHTHTHTQK